MPSLTAALLEGDPLLIRAQATYEQTGRDGTGRLDNYSVTIASAPGTACHEKPLTVTTDTFVIIFARGLVKGKIKISHILKDKFDARHEFYYVANEQRPPVSVSI